MVQRAKAGRPAAGHLVREFLPRSQTFVYTLLRHQTRYDPVVLAEKRANAAEFPFEPVVDVGRGDAAPPRRTAEAVGARLAGFAGAQERRVVQAARHHGCTLLHAHFAPVAARNLGARAKLGVPLVTTFYGFDLGLLREDPEWRAPYGRLFDEGALFLCEGPVMASELVRFGGPEEKVRVAKIGIDLSTLPFEPRVRDRPLVLLQTGRFVEKKGFDVSIRALAKALPRLGEAELRLIGDGPERGRLESLASELGVEDSVRFLGSLPYDEYTRAMDGAHIGLQPSRTAADGDTEGGAPTVLLEMQAVGIPVAGTGHADIPSVVAAPEALVEEEDADGLAEAILRLADMSDAEWRERCERGRALVESEHDAARVAAQVEALYDEALGR